MSRCQFCGEEVSLRDDGTINSHDSGIKFPAFSKLCIGTGSPPCEESVEDIQGFSSLVYQAILDIENKNYLDREFQDSEDIKELNNLLNTQKLLERDYGNSYIRGNGL